MNVLDFNKMKKEGKKLSMITCYDFWSAKIINDSEIDCILVGDSGAMVMHGENSTVGADIPMMTAMTRAVRLGAPDKFIVGDMPFLSFRKGIVEGMQAVDALMKAGANAIKLEGVHGHEELVSHIVASGVPVMGHLGLTPQSVHGLGGHKVQGRDELQASRIMDMAQTLEALGCFSLVLECVPTDLANQITKSLNISTIGIGAGVGTDGQVLVMQDMLGMDPKFQPKFLRKYFNGYEELKSAFNTYNADVKSNEFPSSMESY